jgi:hypothetical protein
MDRVNCRLESCVAAVTRGLDDVATVPFYMFPEYGIVACQRRLHHLRMLLPEPGTAFNVGEQEGKSAQCGRFDHQRTLQ